VIFLTQLKSVTMKRILKGIVLGIFFALALVFQNFGAAVSSASKCAFLTVSYVMFVPLIEAIFLKKRLTGRKALSVILCLTGVGLITLGESFRVNAGDMFLLATGFFYALHLLWGDRCADGILIIHSVQIWTASVIALAVALISEPFSFSCRGDFLFSIIYCGIFELLLGFFLQIKGQQNTDPSLAGIILSSECVFAAIFGVVFQGDSFGIKMLLGCALVFISAVTESLGTERTK